MKATELREMTDVELAKQLKDLKAELFNLRFQHAINSWKTRCASRPSRRTSPA